MEISKSHLKQLIRQILSEVKTQLKEEASESPDQAAGEDAYSMSKSKAAEKKNDETLLTLRIKGVKPGGKMKKLMAQLAADARSADLEVLRAELSRGGKPIETMDASALEREHDIEPDFKNPKSPDELSHEERLALIKQGEREGEWQQATDNDLAAARKRAGADANTPMHTYERGVKLPKDSKLWTDKNWKEWERLHPQKPGKVKFNIPRYEPED